MPSTWQLVCIVCNYAGLEKQLFISFKASCACTVTIIAICFRLQLYCSVLYVNYKYMFEDIVATYCM